MFFFARYVASKKAKPNKLFADFDNQQFWEHARRLAKYNLVFISEESAPEGWITVWSKDYRRGLANQRKYTDKFKDGKAPSKMSVEKLFMWERLPDKKYFKSPEFPF
jgi:hypothetical protein